MKRYSHLTEQHKRSLVDRMAAGCLAMAKLSDAVREALMAAKGLDGIDIEAICPGITSSELFEQYCQHVVDSDVGSFRTFRIGACDYRSRPLGRWAASIANQRAHEQSCKEAKALELLEQAAIRWGLTGIISSKIPEDDSIAGRFAQAADDHFGALIGKRGRASCNESATRAMHIRLIALAVPARFNARYAFVTDVANRIGIDVTRQYVRALAQRAYLSETITAA